MVRHVSIWIMLILGVAVIEAQALTRTLAWEAPLTNTDGTPVAVTGYTMYRSVNGATFIKQGPMLGATTLTYTDPDVPTGDICYEVTAQNANGESARSNRACFSVPQAVPNPPTNLSVRGAVAAVKPAKHK